MLTTTAAVDEYDEEAMRKYFDDRVAIVDDHFATVLVRSIDDAKERSVMRRILWNFYRRWRIDTSCAGDTGVDNVGRIDSPALQFVVRSLFVSFGAQKFPVTALIVEVACNLMRIVVTQQRRSSRRDDMKNDRRRDDNRLTAIRGQERIDGSTLSRRRSVRFSNFKLASLVCQSSRYGYRALVRAKNGLSREWISLDSI